MTTCYNLDTRTFFVHIPKCAGSAIGGELRMEDGEWQDCFLNDVQPGWIRGGLPNGHQPVRAIEYWTGKPLDWWDKILVTIRNPFEQQLSQWAFWRRRARMRIDARDPRYHPDERWAISVGLDQFVQDAQSNGPVFTCGRRWEHAGGVYRWWCADWDNQVPGNVQVIRTEDLPGGLSEALGVDCSALPVTNTTAHSTWQDTFGPAGLRACLAKFSWSLALYYPDIRQEALDLLNSQQTAAVLSA